MKLYRDSTGRTHKVVKVTVDHPARFRAIAFERDRFGGRYYEVDCHPTKIHRTN